RVDRPLRVEYRLAPRELTHQALTLGGERHHGRGRPRALRVGEHRGVTVLRGGDHRVRGSEIDSYCLRHCSSAFPRSSSALAACPDSRRTSYSVFIRRRVSGARPAREEPPANDRHGTSATMDAALVAKI